MSERSWFNSCNIWVFTIVCISGFRLDCIMLKGVSNILSKPTFGLSVSNRQQTWRLGANLFVCLIAVCVSVVIDWQTGILFQHLYVLFWNKMKFGLLLDVYCMWQGCPLVSLFVVFAFFRWVKWQWHQSVCFYFGSRSVTLVQADISQKLLDRFCTDTEYNSLLTLTISLKHHCAEVQPYIAARMAIDSWVFLLWCFVCYCNFCIYCSFDYCL